MNAPAKYAKLNDAEKAEYKAVYFSAMIASQTKND